MLAFRNTQVRKRIVEVRERNAVTRQNLTSAQITYMRWKQSNAGAKPKPAPKPSPAPGAHADSETENAARVIRHCGSAEDFFAQMLPLEPIGDALRRIHHEIQNGTFRPLAPGEPPRWKTPSEASPESLSDASPLRCVHSLTPGGKHHSVKSVRVGLRRFTPEYARISQTHHLGNFVGNFIANFIECLALRSSAGRLPVP